MSQKDWEHILSEKEGIIAGTIVIPTSWSIEDVLNQANEDFVDLTVEQAKDVLCELRENHDCNFGVNWETISHHIAEAKKQEEQENQTFYNLYKKELNDVFEQSNIKCLVFKFYGSEKESSLLALNKNSIKALREFLDKAESEIECCD